MMKINALLPLMALNKAFKKVKPLRADTSQEEAAIDKLVYELYGLSDEEIGIVEGVE